MNAETEIRSEMLDETLALLRDRPSDLSYRRIAEETGLGIWWLQMLARTNGTNDPGVKRVETLHRYLVGQKAAA